MIRPIHHVIVAYCSTLGASAWAARWSTLSVEAVGTNAHALQEAQLLPNRKHVDAIDNAYLKLKDISKNHNLFVTELMSEVTPYEPIAKYSDADVKRLLAFRSDNRQARTALFPLASKACLVPESLAMLLDNLSGVQDLFGAYLTSDAAAVVHLKVSSQAAASIFAEHLHLARMFLSCEGSLVHSIVAAGYLGAIVEYVHTFADSGVIAGTDAQLLVALASAAVPRRADLKEQLRRTYRYEYLWAISQVEKALLDLNQLQPFIAAGLYSSTATVHAVNEHFRELLSQVEDRTYYSSPSGALADLANYAGIPKEIDKKFMEMHSLFETRPLTNRETKQLTDLFNELRGAPQPRVNILGRLVLRMLDTDRQKRIASYVDDLLRIEAQLIAIKYFVCPRSNDKLNIDYVNRRNDFTFHRFIYNSEKGVLGWQLQDNWRKPIVVTVPSQCNERK